MNLTWKKYRLLLKETFSIAYGNYDYRDSLTIILSKNGEKGYGECVAINYYQIDLDDFEKTLSFIQSKFSNQKIVHPNEFYQTLLSFNLHPFLLSAIDCAYWDLYGKLEQKSFAELNKIETSKLPESSYTISIATIDEQIKKINDSSWEKFKVKCNSLDKDNVFRLFSTGKTISLDSNASFSDDECAFLQNNPLSEQFLYIEQPRPIGEFQILDKNLHANWMADEDFQNVSYLPKLQNHYSSVNIKLMKCGGLTPALELISEARKFGYKIMIGCMTESSIGISAGIAIAPLCDFADLDSANLISNDHASGSFVENGKLVPSEKAGLGISLK